MVLFPHTTPVGNSKQPPAIPLWPATWGGVHRAFVRYLFLQYHQDAIFVCGGMLGPVLTSAAQEKRQDASAAAFVGMTAALLYYHHTGVEATK